MTIFLISKNSQHLHIRETFLSVVRIKPQIVEKSGMLKNISAKFSTKTIFVDLRRP
jgi:hypothetical protein